MLPLGDSTPSQTPRDSERQPSCPRVIRPRRDERASQAQCASLWGVESFESRRCLSRRAPRGYEGAVCRDEGTEAGTAQGSMMMIHEGLNARSLRLLVMDVHGPASAMDCDLSLLRPVSGAAVSLSASECEITSNVRGRTDQTEV